MRGISIRWLLLGVAAASLVVPLIAFLTLRNFDSFLIRQTERELGAQGAVIAASYQEAWAEALGQQSGNPRDRWHKENSYVPFSSTLYSTQGTRAQPVPEALPERALTPAEASLTEPLGRVLKNAQVFNLSGVRILAADGCAVASSRAQIGSCFSSLPEVETALRGQVQTALRARVSDEPAPPLASLSRRGETRVFLALPVWNDGELIGAVWLSRTAESGAEWLFKRRKGILFASLLVLALTTAVSIAFSWFITRPLSKMAALLRSSGEALGARLSDVSAPLEIHTLALALDERAEALERKNRYVAEFAENVSHELKTPLTSIRGAAELLQDSWATMSEEQRRRFLQNIDAAAERTERLVTRLLYLARLESPRDEVASDSTSVRAFFARLGSDYGSAVQVSWGTSPEGGDREVSEADLEAIVGNLVENALRYRRKEPVKIEVEMPVSPNELLHLLVRDDGPGIPLEDQARLFDRFFTTERDKGGTGLGLSIVRATAERRGGHARVTSDPSGTKAEVWF